MFKEFDATYGSSAYFRAESETADDLVDYIIYKDRMFYTEAVYDGNEGRVGNLCSIKLDKYEKTYFEECYEKFCGKKGNKGDKKRFE